ncbi:unnamed protein product, partial [Gulo gulo]
FITPERQQYLGQKFGANQPKCTRPPRYHLCIWTQNPFWQWQDTWPWHDLGVLGVCEKNEPKHRLARHGLDEKKEDIRKTAKGTQEQNEEVILQRDCKSQCGCWQKVSRRLDSRSQGSSGTLSVVIVQIFH